MTDRTAERPVVLEPFAAERFSAASGDAVKVAMMPAAAVADAPIHDVRQKLPDKIADIIILPPSTS